jgi:hypothetical protein
MIRAAFMQWPRMWSGTLDPTWRRGPDRQHP